MRDYDKLRELHLAYAVGLAPRFIERLEWPAYSLSAYRVRLLRELAREATARSPWHRDRLANVDPSELDELSLRDLPPMTKTDLMENFDQIVTDDRLSLELVND